MSRNNKLILASLLAWGAGEGLWWYLLPIYIGSLGADSVQIGFVLSVAMILMTISFIPTGWIGDRVSRKHLMLIGWFAGLFAVIFLGLAQTWQQALPALVLYNLSGFCMPIINSYVTSEVRPGENMQRTFTTVFTGFTIGSMFSPSVGGRLADVWGLRYVFLLSALFLAISTAIILLLQDQPVQRSSADSERSSLRGNRLFVSLCALFFAIHLVAHLGIPLSPNYLQDVRRLPMASIGILGSVNALGGVVLTLGLGRWASGRINGLLVALACVGAYAALILGTSSLPLLGLAFFLRGGLGTMRQLAGARLGEILPAASLGLGFGVFSTVVNIAFTISPYIAGLLYAADPSYPFIASLALTIPAMALTVAIGRQGPVRSKASSSP